MSEFTPAESRKHVKAYMAVFLALIVGTFVTVAVAMIPWLDLGEPGKSFLDYSVGLLIAIVKASLVALIFMHLNHEKGMIYKIMLFTMCFAFVMMFLIVFSWWNPIQEAFTSH